MQHQTVHHAHIDPNLLFNCKTFGGNDIHTSSSMKGRILIGLHNPSHIYLYYHRKWIAVKVKLWPPKKVQVKS